MKVIEPGDKCENPGCDHHASVIWTGDGGSLAVTREYMQSKWCRCCTLKAQLKHARRMARRVKSLERELEKACTPKNPTPMRS